MKANDRMRVLGEHMWYRNGTVKVIPVQTYIYIWKVGCVD